LPRGEGIEGAGPVELRDCNMKNLFSTELLKIFIALGAAVTWVVYRAKSHQILKMIC
jgi:hypothetical protein